MDIINFVLTLLGVAALIVAGSSLIIAIRGHILSHTTNPKPIQDESHFVVSLLVTTITIFIIIGIILGFYYFNPQTIYSRVTSGNPAVNDPLSNQDSYSWNTGQNCYFTNGGLRAIEIANFTLICMAEATNFRNFAFQVQMTINSGYGGGLVFRASNYRNLYEFALYFNGIYYLSIVQSNYVTKTLTNGSVIINPNQFNVITVVSRDSFIYLYINRQFVSYVFDSTYNFGEIGIFASHNSDVTFNNAQVWEF